MFRCTEIRLKWFNFSSTDILAKDWIANQWLQQMCRWVNFYLFEMRVPKFSSQLWVILLMGKPMVTKGPQFKKPTNLGAWQKTVPPTIKYPPNETAVTYWSVHFGIASIWLAPPQPLRPKPSWSPDQATFFVQIVQVLDVFLCIQCLLKTLKMFKMFIKLKWKFHGNVFPFIHCVLVVGYIQSGNQSW